ncbi:hypothetical protein GYH30_000697 [Glycine max]|nr:hypothetical protein GYH30_000697 [Glycine max]
MVENTHSARALEEVEDRAAARLETHLIKLAGNIQKALGYSLKDSLQELVKNMQEHNATYTSSGPIPHGQLWH